MFYYWLNLLKQYISIDHFKITYILTSLNLNGNYWHKQGTRPPSCNIPWQPIINTMSKLTIIQLSLPCTLLVISSRLTLCLMKLVLFGYWRPPSRAYSRHTNFRFLHFFSFYKLIFCDLLSMRKYQKRQILKQYLCSFLTL